MQTTDSYIINGNSKPRAELLGIGVLLIIATGFFYPMLFDGKVIFYRDFQFITYPIRYFLSQAYDQGVIPYWTTNTFGGAPFMATMHPGVFYPPSLFFFLDDFTLALNLFYVFHFLVMGIFVFLLARKWHLSWFAALCCGVTGMLGGLVVASTLCSNYFLSSVWLPIIFWLYYQFEDRGHLGWFVGLVLMIAVQTLAACPEISVITMIVLYLHAIAFTTKTRNRMEIIRITGTLGLAVVFALGLSACQLMPTAQLLQHTFRGDGLDFDFHARWSLEPSKLTTFILSPGYKEYLDAPVQNTVGVFSGLLHTAYMGIFGFAFVVMAFLFRKDRAVKFWLMIFFFGIFFALGKYNPVYELIYNWTPFLNLFRYPEKYLFASSIAVVFLVGYVLDALITATQTRQINVFKVITFLLLIFGAASILAVVKSDLKPQLPLAFIIVLSVTYILFYFHKIKKNGFAAIVFVMILMDLTVKDFQLLPLIDRNFYEEPPMLMDVLGGSAGKYRTYSGHIEMKPDPMSYPNGPTRLAGMRAAKQQMYPFQGMIFGVEHVGGVPGLAMDILNHMIWYQYLIHSEPDRRRIILERSNVKYWIDGDTKTNHAKGGFPIIFPDRVKVFKDVLPRAFLVPRMKVPEKGQVLLEYYDQSFDPYKVVLLSDHVEFQESSQFNGEVREVTYSPNHVTVKTSQEGNGFLVLLDTHLPGWTVAVDGQKQKIFRANGFYRAVQLGSGDHTLEFDYFPDGLKEGLIITGVTPILGLVGYVLWRTRRRFQHSK